MFLSHLADGVNRAGGHWEVANGSHLRGAALHDRSREQKNNVNANLTVRKCEQLRCSPLPCRNLCVSEADSRMGSAGGGAWPIRPPVLCLRARPSLRPGALARILSGGSLPRLVLLPPSSQ